MLESGSHIVKLGSSVFVTYRYWSVHDNDKTWGGREDFERDDLKPKGERAFCTAVNNSGLEEAKSVSENAHTTYGNHTGRWAEMWDFHLRRLQGGGVFLQNGFS